MAEERSFVIVTDQPSIQNWLARSLRELGSVMVGDPASLESVLQLVDVTGTCVLLVSLSRAGLRQDSVLIITRN